MKYNFNYDKGAENVFGFTSKYPNVESWEFCNNTSEACLFHASAPENFDDDFEARYPDKYKDLSKFRIMHDWVVSTWQDGATDEKLDIPYTAYDGTVYTRDDAAYRLAKFKTEFEDHFDMDFCLTYYVYTFVMLMVDQRAKNMFLTTWDGVHWQPWLYDNDTCLGINNEGDLVFDYYHEDIDVIDGARVYNGQDSALWVNFRMSFPDEIQEEYQRMRSDKLLTFDKVCENFITNGSDKWSISVYNEDADFKYISMLRSDNDASNLYQVRGTGEEHLKYFVDNRINYCDSKWYATDYAADYATLRIYTPSTWEGVAPNANITVTPYSNMYAGVRYKANGTLIQHRAEENVPVTFEAPKETFNDTETAIYGASGLASLGDLSPLYCGTVNVANAINLTTLKIGDATPGYMNPNLTTLAVGANKLLKKIDIQNCPNLTAPLAISRCDGIEEIYAKGSGITGVELPNSGYLKIMELPGTITNLTLKNQTRMTSFSIESTSQLTTLVIENTPNIPIANMLATAKKLNRVRLMDVDWTFDSTKTLHTIAKCGGIDENGVNVDKPQVSGKCHVSTISRTELNEFAKAMPYLTITFDKISCEVIFMSEDGSEELCRSFAIGTDVNDPVRAGEIDEPTKEPTAEYSYTYAGWSLTPNGVANANALVNVTSDRVVYAAFSQAYRYYTIRFLNSDGLVLQSGTFKYGTVPTYNADTVPLKPGETDESFWAFKSWDKPIGPVVADTDYVATYAYVNYTSTKVAQRTLADEYYNSRIESVGMYALSHCDALTSVEMPNVTKLGNSAFNDCSALTTVKLEKVSNIGNSAFYNCTALTSVTIPEATVIGSNAFNTCSALTSIKLPKATNIESNAFSYCGGLKTVEAPKAVTVRNASFNYCESLTSIDLPVAASINNGAFSHCTGLTSINVPEALSIDSGAFSYCSGLTSVTLPKVSTVATNVFSYCSALEKVDIAKAVYIDTYAFFFCSKLTAVIIRTATVPNLANVNAFASTPIKSGTGYIYVPSALVAGYKTSTNWSTYADQIRAIEDYPDICGTV